MFQIKALLPQKHKKVRVKGWNNVALSRQCTTRNALEFKIKTKLQIIK
jgi:hypothetical protein